MAEVEIVPATADHLRQFFGDSPRQTVRAWAVLLDGKPVGLGGFAYGGDYITVFSDLRPEIRPYRKVILKAAQHVMREAVSRHQGAVMAIADPNEPTAPNFLKHLGFLWVGTSPQGEVYQWLN